MLANREVKLVVEVFDTTGNNEFFHVRARPCYLDGNEIRFFPDYSFDDECQLSGLVIDCQGDIRSTRDVYGQSVHYLDVHTVDLRRAEWMVKCLRRLEKRLEAMDEKLGRTESFTQFLVRIGVVLKVGDYLFRPTPALQLASGYSFHWCTAQNIGYRIDSAIHELRKPYLQQEVEA